MLSIPSEIFSESDESVLLPEIPELTPIQESLNRHPWDASVGSEFVERIIHDDLQLRDVCTQVDSSQETVHVPDDASMMESIPEVTPFSDRPFKQHLMKLIDDLKAYQYEIEREETLVKCQEDAVDVMKEIQRAVEVNGMVWHITDPVVLPQDS